MNYKKYRNQAIIRLISDLDIAKLATGFGLLQLPKMPELKGKKIEGFKNADIDINTIPYQDKTREKQRQTRIAKEKEIGPKSTFQRKDKSWSREKDRKSKKLQRKEKKETLKRKRENVKHNFDDEDLDELSREVGLMKKLKKGKISKEEFDLAIKDNDDEL